MPKGKHFGRQKGAKIAPKPRSKLRVTKVRLGNDFGVVLGRSESSRGDKTMFSAVLKAIREKRYV